MSSKISSSNLGGVGFKMTTRTTGGKKFRAMMKAVNSPTNVIGYTVGWDEGSFHEDGTGRKIHSAEVGKILEFGAPNAGGTLDNPSISAPKYGTIPSRPFFRTANLEFRDRLKSILMWAARTNKSRRANKDDIDLAGRLHASAVRKSIENSSNWADNTEYTIQKKGHAIPLVGKTGQLIQGVNYDIDRKIDIK